MDLVSQARNAGVNTERLLDEAFGFLERDYNYKSFPIEPGGRPHLQYTKRYHLGGRSISFFVDYDHAPIFGVSISPVDFRARQEVHPDITYYAGPIMLLEVALEKRGHPLKWRKHGSFADALQHYSDLLKHEFQKEILGDFSAYPATEYIVELVQPGLSEVNRIPMGEFSELSAAENCALETLGQVSLGPHASVALTGRYAQ